MQVFDPNYFRGKKTIYVKVPKFSGICHIWDWCSKNKKYFKREVGKKYYVYKWIDVGGLKKQRAENFETFENALAWQRSGEHKPEQVGLLFKDILEKFWVHIGSKIRVTTLETYRVNAKHLAFFNNMEVRKIGPKTIDFWLNEIKKPNFLQAQHRSRLTYRHEVSLLRVILAYYSDYIDDSYQMPVKKRHREDAIINRDRYQEAKNKRKSKYFSASDCEALISFLWDQAVKNPENLVYYSLARFQLLAGTRVGETCALSWEDVDLVGGRATVSKTVHWLRQKGAVSYISPLTKTGEPRLVPIVEPLKQALANYQAFTGRTKGLVFSHDGKEILKYREVQHHYDWAMRSLGLPYTGSHILRHTFATSFLEVTNNPSALKKILGHSNMEQTEQYAKVTNAMTNEAVREFEVSLIGANVLKFK